MKNSKRTEDYSVLEKIDTTDSETWDQEDQKEAHALLRDSVVISAQRDPDLDKTSVVKNEIKLKKDAKPFKEIYQKISPSMYDQVRAHLKEMLEFGTIRPSSSTWSSPTVSVRNKDSKLRFCIDLRKMNDMTTKDANIISQIQDTLDCLNGIVWFSFLNLKSWYWKAEISEASKALTACVLGPLRFNKFNRMPFSLTNAHATFQRLMETCSGDLKLSVLSI